VPLRSRRPRARRSTRLAATFERRVEAVVDRASKPVSCDSNPAACRRTRRDRARACPGSACSSELRICSVRRARRDRSPLELVGRPYAPHGRVTFSPASSRRGPSSLLQSARLRSLPRSRSASHTARMRCRRARRAAALALFAEQVGEQALGFARELAALRLERSARTNPSKLRPSEPGARARSSRTGRQDRAPWQASANLGARSPAHDEPEAVAREAAPRSRSAAHLGRLGSHAKLWRNRIALLVRRRDGLAAAGSTMSPSICAAAANAPSPLSSAALRVTSGPRRLRPRGSALWFRSMSSRSRPGIDRASLAGHCASSLEQARPSGPRRRAAEHVSSASRSRRRRVVQDLFGLLELVAHGRLVVRAPRRARLRRCLSSMP